MFLEPKGAGHLQFMTEPSWQVKIGKCRRPFESLLAESVRAARECAEEARNPLILCFNGRAHPTYFAHAFKQAGIEFKVGLLAYENGINSAYIDSQKIYYGKFGIPIETFPFAIHEFLNGARPLESAREFGCVTPFSALQIETARLIAAAGLTPVLANLDLEILLDWEMPVVSFGESMLGIQRYFATQDTRGVGAFSLWSPELIAAQLVDPFVEKLATGGYITRGSLSSLFESMSIRDFKAALPAFSRLPPELLVKAENCRRRMERQIGHAARIFEIPYQNFKADFFKTGVLAC